MHGLKALLKYHHSFDPKCFKSARCLLTISVGQEVHEGEALDITIDVVNRHFGSVILLIDDSLQRHTMALHQPLGAEAFYEPALNAGDAWLSRNAAAYQRLQGLSRILRWDHWLKHPEFKTQEQYLRTQLKQDPAYRDSMDQTIEIFLHRYCRRLTQARAFNHPRAQGLCLDYLLEECTALCLWPELQCQFEVYPSPRNQAMTYTHQQWVLPQYPDLLHPIALKFKHRKPFKPQSMET